MSYVWTADQIERYLGYYEDLRTHHTYTYASYATTTDFARSVLPPCLEPADEPTVTIALGAFMEWIEGVPNRVGRDRVAAIGVNARHGDEEGMYYLTAIEEEEVNIVTGRELWGTAKKQGSVDFFEDGESFFAVVERKGHRLIEMRGTLGEEVTKRGEESEIYFELRGYFGPNGRGLSGVQLVVFENTSLTKRSQPMTDVSVKLGESPFDPGVATVKLGDLVDAGHYGGETSYVIRDIVELDGDGHAYAPYLMGRLYDDWPDVRELSDRVVGGPSWTGPSAADQR
ncbi:MAG: acetoacetate decarboxylase family protein [Actinobacteria bacterium]|nr:acetoacetate decarboxylase family protein [Actinomycetota bacterium]